MMKVCTLSNAFSLEKAVPPKKIGGAEACAERISRYLAQNGREVIIITQRPYQGLRSLFPQVEIQENLKVYSFYPLNIFSIYNTHKKSCLAKALWRIIDLFNPLPAVFAWMIILREKPDIIHNHILHGFSQFLLLRLIKATGIPLVQSLHSYGFFCLRCDLLRHNGKACAELPFPCNYFAKISAALIDSIPAIVISPSRFCLELYEGLRFFPYSRKIVLANGIEAYAQNPHAQKSALEGRINILYAGRLVKIKGVDVLIKAFGQIKDDGLRLYIVGEGYFKPELQRLAAGDTRIRFCGKISWHKLKEIYCQSDITVVPSIYFEILGNVILESMASGTPVIASRIGGMPELIQDGYNGCLFEPGNIEELKGTIERLACDPAKLKTMGGNAFASSKKYLISDHILELEKLYAQTKTA
ncbi:MAG: glycosyltransferase family 4 protein [Candidatus Omnitrophota bacterium]